MKYVKSLYGKFKSNWYIIAVGMYLLVFGYGQWTFQQKIEKANKAMAEELSTSRSMDRYEKGLAVYMPGSTCTVRATPDISKQLFVDLAMACARRHEMYLESIVVGKE